MESKAPILQLNLRSPIFYKKLETAEPFSWKAADREKIFCFQLDETQGGSFEPDIARLLGSLLFCGEAAEPENINREPGFELPRGNYIFAQKRELLSKDEIIDLAAEIQKEGLWQRLELADKLYLRYLFEDGSPVTQLFRGLK